MPWSPGISRAEVEKGAANATILVGAFDGEKQIGYARALSDKTRFCYLMDVAVDPDSRRNGVGGAMVRRILNHPELSDVYQWLLFTSSAQEFYRGLGFEETKRAGNLDGDPAGAAPALTVIHSNSTKKCAPTRSGSIDRVHGL